MARPRKQKTGVMPGFPKLAFYTGPTKLINVRRGIGYWDYVSYELKPSELVVLVADAVVQDFENRIPVPGQWWYTYPEIEVFFVVPMNALDAGTAPITSVYNWKEAYRRLPKLDKKLFTVIEKDNCGKGIIAAANAA